MASRLKAKDPISAAPSKPKVLIFGKPGVGKTWTSLDFPGVYYIDSEGGANMDHYIAKLTASGGVYMGPEDGAGDLSVILDQVKALATEVHPYRTLVIDSISKPFNTSVALESERLGAKDVFGAAKKQPLSVMRNLVIWLERLDMNVILIAHEKVEWGLNEKGERSEVGATFDAWEKLEYELHLALRVVKRGKSRTAFVRKSRLLGFPEGESFDWNLDSFADRYGRAAIDAPVTVVQLATAEQVAEVTHLLTVVKADEGFEEKCFAKAGASSWAELDSAQVQKTIDFLKKKLLK